MKDEHRNKHFLGELTFGYLMEIVPIEGDFSLGENWLPITRIRVSKKGDKAGIFMDSIHDEPDVSIPLDTRVKVVGEIVHVAIEWKPLRIRLEKDPEFIL